MSVSTPGKVKAVLEASVDNGLAIPVPGIIGRMQIPFNCRIVKWSMFADVAGDAVVDIWRDTYANYPPLVGDTIIGIGGTKPTLNAQDKNMDTVLTGWSKVLYKDEVLLFNLDAAPAPDHLHAFILQLFVEKI